MNKLPKNWIKKDGKLILTVRCLDFKKAIALLNAIGDIAENLQHHPDLGVHNYNEVFVSTTTHEADDLTEKDYELAQEINHLIKLQRLVN